MEFKTQDDSIKSYMDNLQYEEAKHVLVDEAVLFQWEDSMQEAGEEDYCCLSIYALSPIYLIGSIENIREKTIDDYDLNYYSHREMEDIIIAINAINITVGNNGRLERIWFPTLSKLGEMYGIEGFGKRERGFHGKNTSTWLYDIYEVFLDAMSKYMVSGEMLTSLYTEYFDGEFENDEVTAYVFYMRNNECFGPTLHYEYNALSDMKEFDKHLTHRYTYQDIPKGMDLYNVF